MVEAMTELAAGPQLDTAVALALGWRLEEKGRWWVDDKGEYHGDAWRDVSYDNPDVFAPSTDWNCAMLAAERAGLLALDSFDIWHGTPIQPYNDVWRCWVRDGTFPAPRLIAFAGTGPLCISRAILKVKHEQS